MSEQPTSKKISGPFDFTLAQIQELIDTDPACQCRGHVNASVYGWVPGTKSVWVLEAPTDEQYARLNAFPQPENDEVMNGYLRDVGAVFYADYVCIAHILNRPSPICVPAASPELAD